MNIHDFYALYKKWFSKKEDNKELKEPTYQENKDELHDENGDLKLEYKMDKEKLKQEHERIKNKYK